MSKFIDIVFDGPPSHESGRFVEVEDERGHSIRIGEWIDRKNGLWALRVSQPSPVLAEVAAECAKHNPLLDDVHDAGDWNHMIQTLSDDAAGTGSPAERRKLLVEIAALAVAAIESHDRKVGAK